METQREKYSCYEFEVFKSSGEFPDNSPGWTGWVYKIYGEGCHPYDDGVIESSEWFESEQEARFAAIGHISLLENGES